MSEPLRFDEVPAGQEATGRSPDGSGGEPEQVIVKVRRAGYVPAGFAVRSRVDELLFTADASEADLLAASVDPDVESVERARRLHLP